MKLPETAQQRQCCRWQRHQAILIALGIAYVHTLTFGVDIADLQSQALAETEAQAIDGEVENPVTERVRCQKQTLGFLNGDDIRQTLSPWRFDQIQRRPGLVQNVGVEEFERVQVEFNGAPGMGLQQIGEILEQLRFGQSMDLIIEILAEAPNATGVSLYRLGLKAFELKVFKMGLIIALEIGFG